MFKVYNFYLSLTCFFNSCSQCQSDVFWMPSLICDFQQLRAGCFTLKWLLLFPSFRVCNVKHLIYLKFSKSKRAFSLKSLLSFPQPIVSLLLVLFHSVLPFAFPSFCSHFSLLPFFFSCSLPSFLVFSFPLPSRTALPAKSLRTWMVSRGRGAILWHESIVLKFKDSGWRCNRRYSVVEIQIEMYYKLQIQWLIAW